MVRKNAFEYLEKFSNTNRKKFEKISKTLENLKELLNLKEIPKRIESFDISNTNGIDSIGAMVVFTNGLKDKKNIENIK